MSRRMYASAAVALAGISVLTLAAINPISAQAAGQVQVSLSSQTGTPDWDKTEGPGNDTGPTNDVIRTNDQAIYTVQVATTGTAVTDARITLTIPAGQELRDVPAFCKNPDKLTEIATPTPQLKPPAVPLTADSWRELTSQTLVCAVSDMAANQAQSFQFPAFQRSEVPNGTQLTSATVTVSGNGISTLRASDSRRMTVSSAPRWDLSGNGVNAQEDSDSVPAGIYACAFDTTQACYMRQVSVLISGTNGGKGQSPFLGSVSFTDLLNPADFYGDAVVKSPEWIALGDRANELYAPRIRTCGLAGSSYIPYSRVGAIQAYDTRNSVRNSGVFRCTQPEPGGNVDITITGADWSLYTYPSQVSDASNESRILDDRAYAVSVRMSIDIPVSVVDTFGIGSEGDKGLPITHRYTALRGVGLDGTPQAPTADPLWNNYRTITPRLTKPGGFSMTFAGVPGDPDNTPPREYNPAWRAWYGLPGDTRRWSGQIQAGPRQTVIATLLQSGSYLDNNKAGSAILCDVWDNSQYQLKADNYQGSDDYRAKDPQSYYPAQQFGSDGAAVWNSGFLDGDRTQLQYTIEYGHTANPGSDASNCGGVIFYDAPEKVPGNNPDLVKQKIYSAVNVVRIWTTIPKATLQASQSVRVFFSIGLSVVPGQEAGDIMPNWLSSTQQFTRGMLAKDQMLKDYTMVKSGYQPEVNAGGGGDRLLYAPARSRVITTVTNDTDKTTNASAGDTVIWKVAPRLSSSGASSSVLPQPVVVEVCLPAGVIYQSASITPTVVRPITETQKLPEDAEVTCAPGGTFLQFNAGDHVPNQDIDPIVVTTRISDVAVEGTVTVQTVSQTVPADPSSLAVRSSSAQVSIQQVAGIKLEKTSLTPQTQPNSTTAAKVEQNQWRIVLGNVNAPQAVSDADIIDILPTKRRNLYSDKFSGTMDFVSAQVTRGTNVKVLYTSAREVSSDPRDQSNRLENISNGTGAAGIAWCTAPSDGIVFGGRGPCPVSPSDVTAVRFLRAGDFTSGQVIEAIITMQARGNRAGDRYTNTAEAVVQGLDFGVGPVDATQTVVGSQIGDRVWLDSDADGVQDAGEPGVGNFRVALSGTDNLGNAVTATATTDQSGAYRFTNLRQGNYRVTFQKTSLASGQVFTNPAVGKDRAKDSDGNPTTGVTNPITLGIDQTRTDIDQGIVPSPVDVVWTKTDGTQPVGGSGWKLTGPAGFTPLTITDCVAKAGISCTGPDKDPAAGTLRVTGLRAGAYVLTESKAPAGYVLDATPHKFTVSATQKSPMTIGSFANKPLAVDVTWTKTDGTSPVGGSAWRLTGPAGFAPLTITDCVAKTGTSCTGSDKDPGVGVFRLTGILPGQYVLTETTAPIGFVLDPTPHRFTVTIGDQSPVALGSFVNHPQTGPRLPLTGGTGMLGLYLGGGGVFLLAGGVGLTQYLRRRRATR